MPTTFTLPPSTVIGGIDTTEATDDLFGEDILFTDDLQITSDGDYSVVNGPEVVRQAIYRRLITRPGEFRVRPEYGVGLQTYVKKKLTQSALDELKRRIEDNLAQEDRIERLVDVVVQAFVTDAGQPGIRVYIKAQIIGEEVQFKPLVFVGGTI